MFSTTEQYQRGLQRELLGSGNSGIFQVEYLRESTAASPASRAAARARGPRGGIAGQERGTAYQGDETMRSKLLHNIFPCGGPPPWRLRGAGLAFFTMEEVEVIEHQDDLEKMPAQTRAEALKRGKDWLHAKMEKKV
ncbi:hypothetical protein NDU88_001735 [Pleurodeles waltl]|uniref:Uncharacterized protein n=1 Tax=Pleurodeles waltl TaxID=8319 RepID=A0AAV7SDI8_PLEWA|nr:hypothetical protein NDU88_001735 [Pleurodeles waltl]